MSQNRQDQLKIFVVAGEASGDAIAAQIMHHLKKRSEQPIEFHGVGGSCMEREGLQSLFPMEQLSVMGLAEVLPRLPDLLQKISYCIEKIEEIKPDLLLTIDSPDFSFRIHKAIDKKAKAKPVKIHCVAPTVWAWREGRAKKISGFLDLLLCLFPFEPDYFKKYGLPAEFIGNPAIQFSNNFKDSRQKIDLNKKETINVGLLFGSRKSEILRHGKIITEVARNVQLSNSSCCFKTLTLPHLRPHIEELAEHFDVKIEIEDIHENKWHFLHALDAALAVSGTMGFELAVARVPHAILYKMNPLSWLIIKNMVSIKHAHMANIIMDKVEESPGGAYTPVRIKEFIQKDCNVETISKYMKEILFNEAERKEKILLLDNLQNTLIKNNQQDFGQNAVNAIFRALGK